VCPEFETKFLTEVPSFMKLSNFPYNTVWDRREETSDRQISNQIFDSNLKSYKVKSYIRSQSSWFLT